VKPDKKVAVVYLVNLVILGFMTTGLNLNLIKFSLFF